jgi:hypothetical protein
MPLQIRRELLEVEDTATATSAKSRTSTALMRASHMQGLLNFRRSIQEKSARGSGAEA